MIRQPRRPPDGAEKNCVEAPQGREEILRGHAPGAVVVSHAPIETLRLQLESANRAFSGSQDRHRGVDDFTANSISGVERDAMGFQSGIRFSSWYISNDAVCPQPAIP